MLSKIHLPVALVNLEVVAENGIRSYFSVFGVQKSALWAMADIPHKISTDFGRF